MNREVRKSVRTHHVNWFGFSWFNEVAEKMAFFVARDYVTSYVCFLHD